MFFQNRISGLSVAACNLCHFQRRSECHPRGGSGAGDGTGQPHQERADLHLLAGLPGPGQRQCRCHHAGHLRCAQPEDRNALGAQRHAGG